MHDTEQALCIHCEIHLELCSFPSTSLQYFIPNQVSIMDIIKQNKAI